MGTIIALTVLKLWLFIIFTQRYVFNELLFLKQLHRTKAGKLLRNYNIFISIVFTLSIYNIVKGKHYTNNNSSHLGS